jgi:hydroxyacylglutathione hydrolase
LQKSTKDLAMFLKQYYLGCLAHASYLLADEATGTAIVVDPQRDIQQYLDDARERGFSIRHVFLTHFHADFVAGHLELRDRCGAAIHLGARATAEYAFVPMRDGDALEFPNLRVQALETPGHTIESISLLVFGAKTSDRPHAVLTGDTLFIGDVGRPDLRASLGWSAAELGSHLYRSLREKLLPLPDQTLVYPAHGAGSLCGKHLSGQTVSTLGEQRRFNYALQPMTEDQFVALVTADQPDAPPYFTFDAVLNTREHATLERTLEEVLRPLDLDEFLRAAADGAQILDVRHPDSFARAHCAGSLNIALDGQFATWAGTILDPDRPVLLIADRGREQEAATRLGRIGFDRIHGYLRDGMEAFVQRPELLVAANRLAPALLSARLAAAGAPLLLDVRTPPEWAGKRIAGSRNLPLSRLPAHLQELPHGQEFIVLCAGGYRSSIAASLLRREGFINVAEMTGGMAAWEAAEMPVIAGPADEP